MNVGRAAKRTSATFPKRYEQLSKDEQLAFQEFLALRAKHTASEQSSKLCSLPPEIQALICSQLPSSRDVSRYARTCRTLKAVIDPLLYETLDLRLCFNLRFFHEISGLFAFLPEGLRFVKRIAISTKSVDANDEYEDFRLVGYDDYEVEDDLPKRVPIHNVDRVELLNWLVQRLIEKIPTNQLTAIIWHHRYPINMRTINLVRRHHSKSWRELRIRDFWKVYHEDEKCDTPTSLSAIEVRNICMGTERHGDDPSWLKTFIKENKPYLRELKLGQEEYHTFRVRGWSSQGTRRISLQPFFPRQDPAGSSDPFNLTVLEIVGLEIDCLVEDDLAKSSAARLRWSSLQRLVLESCSGSRELLNNLAEQVSRSGHSRLRLNLKELVFRYEVPGERMITALEKFLIACPPLRVLSVLVDGNGLFRSGPMLANHMASLKVLVWEIRMVSRNARNLEVLPQGAASDVHESIKKCSKLVEVGFPIDWKTAQRGDGSLSSLAQTLATFKDLRTLHIRNVPLLRGDEDDDCDEFEDNIEMDRRSRSVVTELVEEIASIHIDRKEKSSLDLIAVGPLRYRERWVNSSPRWTPSPEPPAYARPICFGIDYVHSQKFDVGIPLVKEICQETLAEARQYTPHLRCFESYWLH